MTGSEDAELPRALARTSKSAGKRFCILGLHQTCERNGKEVIRELDGFTLVLEWSESI